MNTLWCPLILAICFAGTGCGSSNLEGGTIKDPASGSMLSFKLTREQPQSSIAAPVVLQVHLGGVEILICRKDNRWVTQDPEARWQSNFAYDDKGGAFPFGPLPTMVFNAILALGQSNEQIEAMMAPSTVAVIHRLKHSEQISVEAADRYGLELKGAIVFYLERKKVSTMNP